VGPSDTRLKASSPMLALTKLRHNRCTQYAARLCSTAAVTAAGRTSPNRVKEPIRPNKDTQNDASLIKAGQIDAHAESA